LQTSNCKWATALNISYSLLFSYSQAVGCRGLVMPGATVWFDAPLPNSSIEQ